MNCDASHARVRKLFFVPASVYAAYILLLGPFWALDGRYDVVSERVRSIVWAAAMVVHRVPLAGWFLEDYLDMWYVDLDAGEITL